MIQPFNGNDFLTSYSYANVLCCNCTYVVDYFDDSFQAVIS